MNNRESMSKENNLFIEDPAWEAEAIQFAIEVEEKILPVGRKILSSSFTGGPRYYNKKLHEAIDAIDSNKSNVKDKEPEAFATDPANSTAEDTLKKQEKNADDSNKSNSLKGLQESDADDSNKTNVHVLEETYKK